MKKLLLIDANSLIHRSFHALPPLTSPEGKPTGALYGLAGALLKILKEQRPDYVAAAFDRPEPTFRKEMYGEYKAHRPETPKELAEQLEGARVLFDRFGIETFDERGFEADDIIGTFAKRFGKKGDLKIIILTGDLDTLQLVEDEQIVVVTPKRGVSETIEYNETAVRERYGLSPGQIPDYKGLVGDASDNIPGVRGVGPKTATGLLQEFGTIEMLFKTMSETDKRAPKVLPFKREALFSKELGTIRTDAAVSATLDEIVYESPSPEKLTEYFEEKGFVSLLKRLPQPKNETRHTAQGTPKKQETAEAEGFEIAWEWKPIIKELVRAGGRVPKNIFDCSVAGWLLMPDETDFSRETLRTRFLKHKEDNEELLGVFIALKDGIRKEGLQRIYYEIEMPLVEILARMELWGIRLDRKKLEGLLGEATRELNAAAKSIYSKAGVIFNINSPQQVGEVLFKKLGIQEGRIKKTKTGHYSTSEETLSSLRGKSPIIDLLLAYRETSKIKSTYLEPLLSLIETDGRIHTSFIQMGTSTGRLASEKPNLQNIPQESKWAPELRRAFVSEHGWSFFSLDYSQLELRLLAHITKDANLIRAFHNQEDIHTLTASRVLGVERGGVTPELRRIGKTLNFGMIYGMGPRAFAKTSGVSVEDATHFIKKYFEGFPDIRAWQEQSKERVRKNGYAEDLMGRRRWFLRNGSEKSPGAFAEIERAAVNMPIQALEADILKLAMQKSFNFLQNGGWLGTKAKILLSIHDELLFEIRDDILKEVVGPLTNIMEHIFPLDVPLKVDGRTGTDWGSLH